MSTDDETGPTVPPEALRALDAQALAEVTARTTDHYDRAAASFWQGTKNHDVSQNVAALLEALADTAAPLDILDLGCGPGRDLMTFDSAGHRPVGLDGSRKFVEMARKHSGCEVWHQDFLHLDLPEERFDGVFANAVLFHVPSHELPRVLAQLFATLRSGGVLFSSNPRGEDIEQWQGQRYGSYLCWDTWHSHLTSVGFSAVHHYYRPPGRPRQQQPWLASVWRKSRS